LEKVISSDLSPQEEEAIKKHREIKERVLIHEKQKRKYKYQLAQVQEQEDKR